MNRNRRVIPAIVLVALLGAGCWTTAVAAEAAVDASRDMEHIGALDQLMFWPPREKLAGFRNIDKILPTRKIERGNKVYPLPVELIDIDSVHYRIDGKDFDTAGFMEHNRVAGLLVIKNGRIVTERYALGNNEESRWISFSVTKSVVSMLLGAAIKDGYIRDVSDKVSDYVPLLKGSSYSDVSLRNVLQMASGTQWNEDYDDPESDVNTMPRGVVNLLKVLGSKTRLAEPGDKFNYNTGETNLVGIIVRAAVGNNLSSYLSEKIWKPFGMESDAYWLLHNAGDGEMGGCCINATLRDYGRLGLFAMQGGVLPDGTQVLPEGWMKESTTPSKGYAGYGYLWWLNEADFSARGVFGQLIYINPNQNLIIAIHSAWDKAGSAAYYAHRGAFVSAVADYLNNQ